MNRAIRARDLKRSTSLVPGTAGRHGGERYLRDVFGAYPHIPRTRTACASCSGSSRSRADSQPRRAGDTRLDPRRGRARVLARARLRRRIRQPRSPRGLRRRRRRSRNGPARDQLALNKFLNPAPTAPSADPPPERLQDRQSDRAGADPRARADLAVRGLRLPPVLVSGGFDGEPAEPVHNGSPPRSTTLSTTSRVSSGGRRRDRGSPRWPMLILRTPKGWTGPRVVDGKPVEGTWRAHQVPIADVRDNGDHCPARGMAAQLQAGGAVRRDGRLIPELAALSRRGRG